MKIFAPNYYEKFRCIAGECRHSCCVGWDVYIDEETQEKYKTMGGNAGERVRSHLCEKEDGVCFEMREGGRCPMLNESGLCDIILEKGEGFISEICREHPRFYNFFGDHAEAGLGLSCEEAARIILSQEGETELIPIAENEFEEEDLWADEAYILHKRKKIFAILQERSKSIDERAAQMLAESGAHFPEKSMREWAETLRSLEMLDVAWGEALAALENGENADMPEFERAFEKLLLYFIYRHTPEAADEQNFAARVCFAYLGFAVIRALCAAKKAKAGKCTFAELCDFARRYSAEIEYSIENTNTLIAIMEE
ncbi:MAG: flagellin lysine-N-methylase [Clostridia bacterium]|nr:flagellin lysine-N-methylase [Clostridia bacterium]